MSGRLTENPDTFRCVCSSSEIHKDREKTADRQQIQKAQNSNFFCPNILNTRFSISNTNSSFWLHTLPVSMLWIPSGHDTFGALDANNQYCSKASFWNKFQTKARIILCPSQRLNAIGKIFIWLLLGFPPNPKMYFPCTHCSWMLGNTKRGRVKAFRSLRTSFKLARGLKFMAKLPGGQAFDEIEPIVMECMPVLHNFFMTFVRNTI